MASDDYDQRSFADSSSPSDRYPSSPWPHAVPSLQTQIEDTCFEDGATIHFDRLAPLQFWAPFFGISEAIRTDFVVKHTMNSQKILKRKLNQGEIDALSESAAKQFRYISWVRPVGFAGAFAGAYVGRKTFRFPFYTPKMKSFHPESFPSRSIRILKGAPATWAWHAVRFACYWPGTMVASLLFFGSVVRTNMAAQIGIDPRLASLRDMIGKGKKAEQETERARVRRIYGLPNPSGQQTDKSPEMPRGPMGRRPDSSPSLEDYPADESTEQGYQSRGGFDAEVSQENSLAFERDNSIESRGRQSQDQARPTMQSATNGGYGEQFPSRPIRPATGRTAPARGSTRPQDSSGQSAWDDAGLLDDDDDGASPVAASARRTERQSQSTQSSSWDRVRQRVKDTADARQQAKAPGDPWTSGDRSEQDTTWGRLRQDSAPEARDGQMRGPAESEKYTYNEKEETDSYAKAQAQTEFDAMLEAERRGGDSSKGRWGKS